MKGPPDYDALLFDNDGVLLDVTPVGKERYLRAISRAFEAFGATPDREDLRCFVGGEDLDEIAERCDRLDVPFREFWACKERAVVELLRRLADSGELALYDDVEALHSLSDEYELGVVSNAQQAILDHVFDQSGLDQLFAVVVGREPTVRSARRAKPEPDFVERALDELGTRNALYVGDSRIDVTAANRAGVDAAFLRRHPRGDSPPDSGAVLIESLYDLAAVLDG